MKKILILLTTICCCGCIGGIEKKETVIHENWMVIPHGQVRYIEFDGHQYVQFDDGRVYGGGSLCHSPKCPCKMK